MPLMETHADAASFLYRSVKYHAKYSNALIENDFKKRKLADPVA